MARLLVRGIPLVLVLLAGVLPAWGQDAKGVGVVTALTGRADLKRSQAPQPVVLKLRDDLFVRDVVDTQKESLARILLLGKSTVTVRELSRFEIREETLPDGGQRAGVDLAVGKIRVMVARRLMKAGEQIEIRTPNAVAGVRGSDGLVEVGTLPDGTPRTVVTVATGEFEVALPRARPITAMAGAVSDAGAGVQLVQLQIPGGGIVTPLERLEIEGPPGFQRVRRLIVTLSALRQELDELRGRTVFFGARSAQPPEIGTETTREGIHPTPGGGPVSGGGILSTLPSGVILPTTGTQPVVTPRPCNFAGCKQ
jgi:hypothetical protein